MGLTNSDRQEGQTFLLRQDKMTRYCGLLRRLLSLDKKGEDEEEEEGTAHIESLEDGECASLWLYLCLIKHKCPVCGVSHMESQRHVDCTRQVFL